jgi:hypothetical protein
MSMTMKYAKFKTPHLENVCRPDVHNSEVSFLHLLLRKLFLICCTLLSLVFLNCFHLAAKHNIYFSTIFDGIQNNLFCKFMHTQVCTYV